MKDLSLNTRIEIARGVFVPLGSLTANVLAMGASGSGKTTALAVMALVMLSAGFGGLVFTAKAGEPQLWQRYGARTNRSREMVLFGPAHPEIFNPWQWLTERDADTAALNCTAMTEQLADILQRNKGGQGESEPYWRAAAVQGMQAAADLAVAGGKCPSPPVTHQILQTAPRTTAQLNDPTWQQQSLWFQCYKEAKGRKLSPGLEHNFLLSVNYFLGARMNMPEKTAGSIQSYQEVILGPFLREPLHRLFCGTSTITPEVMRKGAIINLDMALHSHFEAAALAQAIWKFCAQMCIRSTASDKARLIFLWMDEAQNFLHPDSDMQFFATSRSARCVNVVIFQNLPTIYAAFGGELKGKSAAESIVGNCAIKLFFQNSDPVTNNFASGLIGNTKQTLSSFSIDATETNWLGMRNAGDGYRLSSNTQYLPEVQPVEFTRLRRGGKENHFEVDCIAHIAGHIWPNGKNHGHLTYRQIIV